MQKTLFTIDYIIPGHNDKFKDFSNVVSLKDADLILFHPPIVSKYGSVGTRSDKKYYMQYDNFNALKQTYELWSKELREAFEKGKNIFVILDQKEVLYRGSISDNENVSNYSFFPMSGLNGMHWEFMPGNVIKPTSNIGCFKHFWETFGDLLSYKAYVNNDTWNKPFLSTKDNNSYVGTVYEGYGQEGNIIFLPYINLENRDFIELKDLIPTWSKKGISFGNDLVKTLLDIDKALKNKNEITPPPEWINNEKYALANLIPISASINDIDAQVELLINQKNDLIETLKNENAVKKLLFAKDKELEKEVINALSLLGFVDVKNYNDGSSEFDIVFKYAEKHFLGEIEGKDAKPINVYKIRQLSANVFEYDKKFNAIPKAILFGNANRLTVPEERNEFFTNKCIEFSDLQSIVLVKTIDLFYIIKYLKENDDIKYAEACRNSLLNAKSGIIIFPKIPTVKTINLG